MTTTTEDHSVQLNWREDYAYSLAVMRLGARG